MFLRALKIDKVTVVCRKGYADKIVIDLDMPTTYPEMKYPPVATIECQRGEGLRWCRENLRFDYPEVVDLDVSPKLTPVDE